MSDTLPAALRILSRDIHCEDGVATLCLLEAADEIERLRLTDEEREAIQWAADTLCVGWNDLKPDDRDRSRTATDTLRRMLEKTGRKVKVFTLCRQDHAST